ncbi:unnamed protein product [Sphagnum jensenii]|uniref:Uncharacterized protein n=1 Tax=Sphagnum jensenii TaxID=128206 RepID=A0ABP1B734_9BRYO
MASSRSSYACSCVLVMCVCVFLTLFVSVAVAVPGSDVTKGETRHHLRGDHTKPAYDVEMIGNISKESAPMITGVEIRARRLEEMMVEEGRETLQMTNDYASGSCTAFANSKHDPTPTCTP